MSSSSPRPLVPCSWCCFLGLLKASLLQLQADGEITRSTCQNYQCAEKKTSNAAQNEKMDLCSGKKKKKNKLGSVFLCDGRVLAGREFSARLAGLCREPAVSNCPRGLDALVPAEHLPSQVPCWLLLPTFALPFSALSLPR